MDALDLLTADHNRVRGLFSRSRTPKKPTRPPSSPSSRARSSKSSRSTPRSRKRSSTRPCTTSRRRSATWSTRDSRSTTSPRPSSASSRRSRRERPVGREDEGPHRGGRAPRRGGRRRDVPKVRSATDASKREALGEKLEARKVELGGFAAADNDGSTVVELATRRRSRTSPAARRWIAKSSQQPSSP